MNARACFVASLAIVGFACGAKNEKPATEPAPVVGESTAPPIAPKPAPPIDTRTVVEDAAAPPEGSLYARLGGREGLVRIVDAFLVALESDPKLHRRFAPVLSSRKESFKTMLVDELCVVTEGNCTYRGRTMKEAHKGLAVTEPEWNAFMLALKSALEESHVPEVEQLDLLTALAPMRLDIITVSGRRR